MNRPELYFKNSRILINAYRKEKLFHGSWGGCAVGHLIAANMGYVVSPHFLRKGSFISYWYRNGSSIRTSLYGHFLKANKAMEKIDFIRKWGWKTYVLQSQHIRSTGYSKKELKLIIEVFDSHLHSPDESAHVLNALKAVLLVLKKIHEVSIFDLKGYYSDFFSKEKETLTKKLPIKYKWVMAAEEDNYITYESFHKPVRTQKCFFNTKAIPISNCEDVLV